ncbi:MAG TPA: response regulator, partial [Polyangiaceae bacterium]|nr:response regulator [Polyangiaceae bacterium]
MPNSAGNSSHPQKGVRLGGVRADFVANLGKRLAEMREVWEALSHNPSSTASLDELRRHVHALASRSRVLHFDAVARRLERTQKHLERAAVAGGIDAEDVEEFTHLFRDLPELAWNEAGSSQQEPTWEPVDHESERARTDSQPPLSSHSTRVTRASSLPLAPGPASKEEPLAVLVIGRPALADSLRMDSDSSMGSLEVEQTDDLSQALELTRALAPDVLVLDADLLGAVALSESLSLDPLVDSTRVIVVGAFSLPDQTAPFLAHGVMRTLVKPVSPAKLQHAVRSAAKTSTTDDSTDPFGQLTVEELAERLARQLKSELLHTVRPESRRSSVDLGEGMEVQAAVWSAVARIREIVTLRSEGAIRFAQTNPLGAVPFAPWLDALSDGQARRQGSRDNDPEIRFALENRRVLVVDDDPGVTWFLSGLFRAHGSEVREAMDGQQALDTAFVFDPELVFTDILMPKRDGFGLCRALKRDPLLRDVPVVVLSWKEDLLQRVRDLGVEADGYLRKEATSSSILRTVQECLRPRVRIEQRLKQVGEVRGRLEGIGARTLIKLTAKSLVNASITIRDASYLFEIHL